LVPRYCKINFRFLMMELATCRFDLENALGDDCPPPGIQAKNFIWTRTFTTTCARRVSVPLSLSEPFLLADDTVILQASLARWQVSPANPIGSLGCPVTGGESFFLLRAAPDFYTVGWVPSVFFFFLSPQGAGALRPVLARSAGSLIYGRRLVAEFASLLKINHMSWTWCLV